jgi:uncharacterized protein YjbI with pentapeptide repeats
MVSGTQWPEGDPFLQRQNEPTIAISTRNELHLMGGSNDYRTVDLPGLPEGKTTGDSWISSYFSYDGGGRWTSTLVPGYPQDPSCAPGSPVPNVLCGYEASADPVIRTGTHGLFYYSGIAFTRSDDPPSAGFVTTYIDLNNDERGDSIKYVRTAIFDENADGTSFIDKPWIAVDKPRNLATRIIQVETDSGPIAQEVQCGNLYAAYARIQGEGTAATSSQIMFTRSEDCGETFSLPAELTLPDTINQGAAIAVEPNSGRIQVAWRQFENAPLLSCTNPARYWRENPDAWPVDEIELAGVTVTNVDGHIMIDPVDDRDDNGYSKWRKRMPKRVFRQYLAAWLNALAGADTTDIELTLDDAETWMLENPIGSKPKWRARWEGWKILRKLRRFNNGRTGPGNCEDLMTVGTNGMNPNAIMLASSDDFGATFSTPIEISGPNYFPFEQGTTGFSFRSTGYPTMTFDGDGRSYVAWTTRGLAVPDFDPVGGDGRIVVTTSTDGQTWTMPLPIDEPEQRGHQLMPALEFAQGKVFMLFYDFREDVSRVFDRFITDLPVDAVTPRHSVDVRAAQADAADVPEFTNYSVLDGESTQASRYPFLILSDAAGDPVSQQTQYNPPNLPMFRGGLVPFFGDFIDLAALHFVTDGVGNWDFNTDPANGAPVVHAVWTDNRDVVPPPDGDWTSYVPPGGDGSPSIFDPGQTVPVCTPATVADRTKMRNQNIYTSRLTQGLAVAVPGNNRPLGVIERAFVAFVQNLTDQDKLFRLEILNQPVDGKASFEQFPATAPAVTQTNEVVERNSSISRSIYVSSSDPNASVDIRVTEVDASGTPITNGLVANTRINADPSAPAPQEGNILAEEVYTPAIFNPAIFNPAIFNTAVLGTDEIGIANPAIFNPAIFNSAEAGEFTEAALQQMALLNPAIFNPAIFNPAIFNPAIFNPAIFNPAIFNPAIFNPAIFNPAIFNPAIFNPSTANPAIFNPAIFNTALGDPSDDSVVETSIVVQNDGNATAAYSLNLDLESPPEGFLFQVMVSKTYLVPTVVGCDVVETVEQEQLVNELTPDVTGSLLNPEAPTFFLTPGDNVIVTVRVVPDTTALVPGDPATVNTLSTLNLSQAVAPQSVSTEEVNEGETEPTPVIVLAPVVPPLVIDPVALIDGMVSSSYAQMLTTTGSNSSPVSWSLVPSSDPLPPGLTLSPAGQISGTATAEGVFVFDVRAQDDVQLAEQSFSITVLPSGAGATFAEIVILGETDILNDGLQISANNLGSAAATEVINGVSFLNSQAGLAGAWGPGGVGDFSTDVAVGTDLDDLLSNLQFISLLSSGTLTVGGLTPGQPYRLQLLFSNDLNLTGNNIAISVQGDTYVLDNWQDDAINLRVEFVASSPTVVVTFQPGPSYVPGSFPFDEPGRAVLNGYALHAGPFAVGPLVDQQQPVIDQTAGGLGLFSEPSTGGAGQTLVQTVTTGITGSLDAIRLPVQCSSGDLVVQIQGLDPLGLPNGAVLATQITNGMLFPQFAPNPGSLRQISFSSPAEFNAGDTFAIVIDAPGGNCDIFEGPIGNPYGAGQGFFDSRPNVTGLQPLVTSGGRDDLPFQTLVTPGPGPTVVNAALTSVVLGSTTSVIGGTGDNYTATFNNTGSTPLSLVAMQAWIDQPGASRAAGGSLVSCGGAIGELLPGVCNGSFFIGSNNTAAAGFGFLTTGPATARIELKLNDVVIDTFTQPINLVPPPSSNWRADFDFASNPANLPPYAVECVRTVLTFSPPLPAGDSFTVEIFDAANNASLGGPRPVGPFASPTTSVGFETFPSGPNYPFLGSQGYQLLQFSQALNSITGITFRGQTPCSGVGTPNQFVPGRLTALP